MTAPAPLPVLAEPLGVFADARPEFVTILPSYRCNAACAECCFESNPRIKHRMTREALLAAIDRFPDELPDLKYVVFSGGEVTLLREDLIDAIARVTQYGYQSRIVSNGHWGRTDRSAAWWVDRLLDAGLTELTISTGDEHQVFVPIEHVARAANHAVKSGLVTLITVEGKDTAGFTADSVRTHPLVRELLEEPELRQRFILTTHLWMPFHSDTDITNDQVSEHSRPCDNVFENFVVNPYGNLLSCCGLTMEYIPEHTVGNVGRPENLQKVYVDQYADLLKLWIWLDGTRFIFEQAVKAANLDVRLLSPHMCSICAQLYKDPELRAAVADLVRENAEQIVFRAALKARLSGRVPLEPAESDARPMVLA